MVFLPAKSCGHSRTRCADSPFVFKNQTARFTAHMCADTDNRLCHGADCLPPSQPERATWDMVQTSTNHCTAKQEWTECCPRIRSTAEATYACFDIHRIAPGRIGLSFRVPWRGMARMLWSLLLVCLFTTAVRADVSSGTEDGSEEWGYIDSRPGIIL